MQPSCCWLTANNFTRKYVVKMTKKKKGKAVIKGGRSSTVSYDKLRTPTSSGEHRKRTTTQTLWDTFACMENLQAAIKTIRLLNLS